VRDKRHARLKLKRRNSKSFTIKTEDYFDSCIMERLQGQLIANHGRLPLSEDQPATVTFTSKVVARCTDKSGKVKVLLRWEPPHILSDSWVSESDVPSLLSRDVLLSSLSHAAEHNVDAALYPKRRCRKQRRK